MKTAPHPASIRALHALLFCCLLFPMVASSLRADDGSGLPIISILRGKLELAPLAVDTVTITADMHGLTVLLGATDARASWTTNAVRLAEFQAGTREELTIGNGNLNASTRWGTVEGTFTGTLHRLPAGKIQFRSTFTITTSSGRLAGFTGTGKMLGIADPLSLNFRLNLAGVLRR